MNLPNKLTILRVILIIPFVIFLLVPWFGEISRYVSAGIFIIASFTDMADGKIARKYNLVTNFGKFMDPLADKLLVSAAMICLVETGALSAWIVVIIISREFIISGFRLVASDNGVVIAASYWGKFKTVFHMAMVILLILNFDHDIYQLITVIVTYVALILTVVSLVDYVVKNKDVLKDSKSVTAKSLEDIIYKLLTRSGLTVSTAESCTGGLLAGRLINVAGISRFFEEGYVTYSNDAKEKLLKVSSKTLSEFGAVSKETATEMAVGCATVSGTDIGIGVTGIAGPGGGTSEKPVGLVYIGCCCKGNISVNEFYFSGSRSEVRECSVQHALEMLKDAIEKEVAR
jgi:CDP-diacylglycerol--glycerol-3-phosphate 3-phosphatidyltransferase